MIEDLEMKLKELEVLKNKVRKEEAAILENVLSKFVAAEAQQ